MLGLTFCLAAMVQVVEGRWLKRRDGSGATRLWSISPVVSFGFRYLEAFRVFGSSGAADLGLHYQE
jgi:hypothetical protein